MPPSGLMIRRQRIALMRIFDPAAVLGESSVQSGNAPIYTLATLLTPPAVSGGVRSRVMVWERRNTAPFWDGFYG